MISIRKMSINDVPFGMRLKNQAQWNQTEADWRRFLLLEPEGCFVAEREGCSAGTVTTCSFGEVGWIGMLLVAENCRGCGIGTALLRQALTWLEQRSVKSFWLDATPLGKPLYQKFGFEAQFNLVRFEGRSPASPPPDPRFQAHPCSGPMEFMFDLDTSVTGAERRRFLQQLAVEPGIELWTLQHPALSQGFVFTRPGSTAIQIGPLLARTTKAGENLLACVLQEHAGRPVYVDVPETNREAFRAIQQVGLKPQRSFERMCRGQPRVGKLDWLWASSGPEKG